MRARHLLPTLLVLAAPALLAGCDAVAGAVGVDAFDVALGDNARLPVVPDASGTAGSAVAVDARIPDVFDVSDISIPEDAVTFEPAPGGGGSCTVSLYVMFDRVPGLQSTITLDGNDVQRVTSRFARTYDRGAICAGVEGCPVVSGSRTAEQIRSRINAAIGRRSFDLDIVGVNAGPCAGVLTIERLHFELDF